MMLIKLLILITITLLPWDLASADDFTNKALSIITVCFNKSLGNNDKVMNCMGDRLRNIPNPMSYKVSVKASNPDANGTMKILIFMINDGRYIYLCISHANNRRMYVGSCTQDKGTPLTPTQKLSIDTLIDI